MRNTYFDTQKIMVEIARPIGSQDLSRPWSKYAHGSSAHKRLNPDAYPAEEEEWQRKKKAKRDTKAKKGTNENLEKNEQLSEYLQMGKKKKKDQTIKGGKSAPLAAIAELATTEGSGLRDTNINDDDD